MKKLKAISIAGGGENGAVTVGRLSQRNIKYDIGDGTSTGSLMLPFVMLNKWDELERAYGSVSNKDILERSAFKGEKVRWGYIIKRFGLSFVGGRKSIGTSNNLLKKINEFITEKDFDKINHLGKIMYVSAFSYNYKENVSFRSDEWSGDFEGYKKKIWHSANAPFVMSVAKDTRYPNNEGEVEEWGDGGIDNGHESDYLWSRNDILEVDLVLHRDRPERKNEGDLKNMFDVAKRVWDARSMKIANMNVDEVINLCQNRKINLRVHWTPKELIQGNNAFTFDQEKMRLFIREGKNLGFDKKYIDEYEL